MAALGITQSKASRHPGHASKHARPGGHDREGWSVVALRAPGRREDGLAPNPLLRPLLRRSLADRPGCGLRYSKTLAPMVGMAKKPGMACAKAAHLCGQDHREEDHDTARGAGLMSRETTGTQGVAKRLSFPRPLSHALDLHRYAGGGRRGYLVPGVVPLVNKFQRRDDQHPNRHRSHPDDVTRRWPRSATRRWGRSFRNTKVLGLSLRAELGHRPDPDVRPGPCSFLRDQARVHGWAHF